MLLRHALGHVLRRLRLEQGKTLRQLAQQSRVSLPYLSEIERGRKEASSEILATLCRVLDVSLGRLLEEASDELALGEGTVLHLTSQNDLGDASPRREIRDTLLMAA
jgi:transcriptional regulator with XRE-family HTH domain